MSHTPEPWETIYNGHEVDIHATIKPQKEILREVNIACALEEANAKRIVACVNYLVGIPLEQLQGTTLKETASRWADYRKKYGFNPAAYGECLKALRWSLKTIDVLSHTYRIEHTSNDPSKTDWDKLVSAQQALHHAQP